MFHHVVPLLEEIVAMHLSPSAAMWNAFQQPRTDRVGEMDTTNTHLRMREREVHSAECSNASQSVELRQVPQEPQVKRKRDSSERIV